MSNASASKVPGWNAGVPCRFFHAEVYHIGCFMVQFDGYNITRFGGWIDNWSSYLCEGSCVWWVKIISYMQVHCTLSSSKCILFNLHLCKRNKQPHTNKSHENVISNVHKRPTKSLTHRKKLYQHIVWNTDSTQMLVHKCPQYAYVNESLLIPLTVLLNNYIKIMLGKYAFIPGACWDTLVLFVFSVSTWDLCICCQCLTPFSGPTKMPRTPWPSLI